MADNWSLRDVYAEYFYSEDPDGIPGLLKAAAKFIKQLSKQGLDLTDVSVRMPDGKNCSVTVYYQDVK